MNVSQKAIDLILEFEGMNQPYRWPGGNSGITIGYGYDLGQVTEEEFKNDWAGRMPVEHRTALLEAIGCRGALAQSIAHKFPFDVDRVAAMEVFKTKSLPKYIAMTQGAFPNCEKLPPDAAGALVSLVYNRGGSTNPYDPGRKEMRDIYNVLQDGVQEGDLQKIADAIRSMKRLWIGVGLNGLLRRRDAEAALVESCIPKPITQAPTPVPPLIVGPDKTEVVVKRNALRGLHEHLSELLAQLEGAIDMVKRLRGVE